VRPAPDLDLAKNRPWQSNTVVSLFGVALVFAWVAWSTFWDTGLYGDNVEQFVWVHSLQWGYYKHPPMPTWLLGGAIHLFGPHAWLTNALAAVCFALTGWLTWSIARSLLDEKVANITIVLWTLQQCFSVSAQIYNHNTVLVMFMAATVYAVLRAANTNTNAKMSFRWWLGAGLFAGCAMLSKYQAALPLFALLATVCITNRQPFRFPMAGLATAGVGFTLVFSPHLYWAVTHQFPALRYASAALESGGFTQRVAWVASFSVNQIRMVLPLVLVIALSWAICKVRSPSQPAQVLDRKSSGVTNGPTLGVRMWMWGLVWAPVVILVLSSLATGSQLRNHWGVQLFQFLPIWIAWRWRNSNTLKLTLLIPLALAAQAAGFTYYAVKQSQPDAAQAERRADSSYPARNMASAALAHWKQQTSCPLKIIGGDFEAGLVSAFVKEFPVVYSGPEATPWVTADQINQHGIMYVVDMNTPLAPDAVAAKKWYFNAALPSSGKYIQLAVKLPAAECKAAP
jgi:4-amino-4-deoxy-L-arabinose transferase-like glycosyltransferase